jgi:acyl-CoA thioester hydrolase
MFKFPIRVQTTEIDQMGHVNNACYLTWVQKAVVAHWEAKATPQQVLEHLWVALRHEIDYRKPGFLEDNIHAQVVLENVRGARAWYKTMIMRGQDVLAEVSSCWCCLDADTKRPVKVGRELIARFDLAMEG